MKNYTPLFPNFHIKTFRKKPRSAQQILAEKVEQLKGKSPGQPGVCFGKFVPKQYLNPAKSGALSRRRRFSKEKRYESAPNQFQGKCTSLTAVGAPSEPV
ncbi:MAG: hypothetical protein OEV42_05995 [Deltaproteobacteria bacterium]|nr:hypothetical protein [Deltaproteobacteria bacterium]